MDAGAQKSRSGGSEKHPSRTSLLRRIEAKQQLMANIDVHAWHMEIDARTMFAFRPDVLALANDDVGLALDAFFHARTGFAALLANALRAGKLRRGKQDGESRRANQWKSSHDLLLLPLPR